jgi:2-iminobutanoate/2-iminopropanoate deaminase
VKDPIKTASAPGALGPYSQAIATDEFVFCSGQAGIDPATGELVPGGVTAETARTLQNLGAVLEAAGLDFGDVVKTNCYLRDMDDFTAFNEVYSGYFPEPYPARTTIQAARLPLDIAVEIEAVAKRR